MTDTDQQPTPTPVREEPDDRASTPTQIDQRIADIQRG